MRSPKRKKTQKKQNQQKRKKITILKKQIKKEENDLDNSRMSGGSDLEKFDEKYLNDKMKEEEAKDFQKINEENKK